MWSSENLAPRTDNLKCIGDLEESQKMRRCFNSFLITVEVEQLFLLFFPHVPKTVV